MDDGLQPIIIDLDELKEKKLEESFLAMFGGLVKMVLTRMFGSGVTSNIKIKGNKRDVMNFGHAVTREAKYMRAIKKHGLNDPRTYKNKVKLQRAVTNFEQSTGLKWPFK
jgi:hypothetical protein